MIKQLEHVALSVSNMDKSIRFYCNVIGMKLKRIIECLPEMHLGDIVSLNRCKARIAHLYLGDTILELFEYQEPRGRKIPKNYSQADHGFVHIGFSSTDIHSDYKKLKKEGIRFFNEPIEFRPGAWVVYFYGPDKEVCELRQTEKV